MEPLFNSMLYQILCITKSFGPMTLDRLFSHHQNNLPEMAFFLLWKWLLLPIGQKKKKKSPLELYLFPPYLHRNAKNIKKYAFLSKVFISYMSSIAFSCILLCLEILYPNMYAYISSLLFANI